MGSEIAVFSEQVRGGLLEEAEEARRLASCLRRLDVEDADAPRSIREAQGALEEFSTRVLEIVETLGKLEAGTPALSAIGSDLERVRIARRATWASIGNAVERLGISLEEAQNDGGIDRVRLLESVRTQSREAAEAARLAARMAELHAEAHTRDTAIANQQAEIARLAAILSQEGHQLVTRVGSLIGPYPAIVRAVRLPIRFLRWLAGRSSQ